MRWQRKERLLYWHIRSPTSCCYQDYSEATRLAGFLRNRISKLKLKKASLLVKNGILKELNEKLLKVIPDDELDNEMEQSDGKCYGIICFLNKYTTRESWYYYNSCDSHYHHTSRASQCYHPTSCESHYHHTPSSIAAPPSLPTASSTPPPHPQVKKLNGTLMNWTAFWDVFEAYITTQPCQILKNSAI